MCCSRTSQEANPSTCILCLHTVHAYYACILCMHTKHAYCACMHTMHACMHTMHAYSACILCMHTLHAYHACMHTMHACILCQSHHILVAPALTSREGPLAMAKCRATKPRKRCCARTRAPPNASVRWLRAEHKKHARKCHTRAKPPKKTMNKAGDQGKHRC